jgi:hypothetical protein
VVIQRRPTILKEDDAFLKEDDAFLKEDDALAGWAILRSTSAVSSILIVLRTEYVVA